MSEKDDDTYPIMQGLICRYENMIRTAVEKYGITEDSVVRTVKGTKGTFNLQRREQDRTNKKKKKKSGDWDLAKQKHRTERIQQCQAQPEEIRGQVLAMQQLLLALHWSKEERFCSICCLLNKFCFCNSLREIASSESLRNGQVLRTLGVDVSLYMHYRELSHMRVSNTGKLLIHACPLSSHHYVCDVEHDEKQFVEKIRVDPENFAILFPSADAIPLKEFAELWKDRSEKMGSRQKIHLVLLDGTWTNAKFLHRRLKRLAPEIGRVALTEEDLQLIQGFNEESDSHKHKLRDYQGSLKERGGTFSVLIHVLQLLASAVGIETQTIEALRQIEQVHEDAYNLQTNFQKLTRKSLLEKQKDRKQKHTQTQDDYIIESPTEEDKNEQAF